MVRNEGGGWCIGIGEGRLGERIKESIEGDYQRTSRCFLILFPNCISITTVSQCYLFVITPEFEIASSRTQFPTLSSDGDITEKSNVFTIILHMLSVCDACLT